MNEWTKEWYEWLNEMNTLVMELPERIVYPPSMHASLSPSSSSTSTKRPFHARDEVLWSIVVIVNQEVLSQIQVKEGDVVDPNCHPFSHPTG